MCELFFRRLDRCGGASTSRGGVAVVYAPQRAWIVAGTLRENVVRSCRYDEQRFQGALRACALLEDVAGFADGADVQLGERGVTLSGGQQARVQLARCVYAAHSEEQGPVVALLDDPLAAVDNTVAAHLAKHAILALAKPKSEGGCGAAVLCATHARHVLHLANQVVVLSGDGAQLACEPHARLLERGGAAAELIQEPTSNASSSCSDEVVALVVAEKAAGGLEKTTTTGSSLESSPDITKAAPSTQLVEVEERTTGTVGLSTWKSYVYAGGAVSCAGVIAAFVLGQLLLVATDAYLLRWASMSAQKQKKPRHMAIYAALCGATTGFAVSRALLFYECSISAANALHSAAFEKVLHAPLRFFAVNPCGRIMTRFSSDQGVVDELLAQAVFDLLQMGFMMLAVAGACVVTVPLVAVALPPLAFVFVRVKRFTSKSMTELKRLDQVTRSPALDRFEATLRGLVPVRAFSQGPRVATHQLAQAVARNSRCWYWWLVSQRHLGFCLDALCVVFLAALGFSAIALRDLVRIELLALALVYGIQLAGSFQWCVRQFALSESYMASVERLLHYGELQTEPDYSRDTSSSKTHPSKALTTNSSSSKASLAPAWPTRGAISLSDLKVRYAQDLPDVLHGVSLEIAGGAKIGVCGRTGSGKSSLVSSICRLNIISGGLVRIDGLDVTDLSLDTLRNAPPPPKRGVFFQETVAVRSRAPLQSGVAEKLSLCETS